MFNILFRKELHPEVASIAAYIRYATREDAENALQKGKAEGLVLSDHHLVLDLADRSIKRDNKKAIFVGNLPLSKRKSSCSAASKFCLV